MGVEETGGSSWGIAAQTCPTVEMGRLRDCSGVELAGRALGPGCTGRDNRSWPYVALSLRIDGGDSPEMGAWGQVVGEETHLGNAGFEDLRAHQTQRADAWGQPGVGVEARAGPSHTGKAQDGQRLRTKPTPPPRL